MKWLILLVLFSCTTKTTTETTGKEQTVVTESEAKPVSPLTVEPCFCMKMYAPVCANGMNYGNSCEAECHGNKEWTDGPCGKK